MSFIGRTHGKIGDKEYTTIDYLDTQKLEKLYPDIKNIKDSVRDIMKNYKL